MTEYQKYTEVKNDVVNHFVALDEYANSATILGYIVRNNNHFAWYISLDDKSRNYFIHKCRLDIDATLRNN